MPNFLLCCFSGVVLDFCIALLGIVLYNTERVCSSSLSYEIIDLEYKVINSLHVSKGH